MIGRSDCNRAGRNSSLRRTIDSLVRKRFRDAAEPIVATGTPQWTNAGRGRASLRRPNKWFLWSRDFLDSPRDVRPGPQAAAAAGDALMIEDT